MRFLPLVWVGLWRRPVRTVLTALCIVIAFVLLGLLEGVNAGFQRAIAHANRNALVVQTRVRGGAPMPISSVEEIRRVSGVTDVAPRSYFYYSHGEAEGVGALATRPEVFFRLMTAFVTTSESLDAMRSTRSGMLATVPLLEALHRKVGDTVTVRSEMLKIDGSGAWTFNIVGVIEVPEAKAPAYLSVINYDYFDQYRVKNRSTADAFYVRINDPTKAVITSKAIDRIFANSSHETRTRSQQARAESAAKQMGDVKFFTNAIMGAVLFTLAFLTGNTLRQSLQDRSREFAVLKAIGYSGGHVLGLAFAEALLLYLPPALLGLGIARLLAPLWIEAFGSIVVSLEVAVAGLFCAACLAFVGVVLPAWSLSRMPVAFALGKR
jgi:putative ABC transport system permease protein